MRRVTLHWSALGVTVHPLFFSDAKMGQMPDPTKMLREVMQED